MADGQEVWVNTGTCEDLLAHKGCGAAAFTLRRLRQEDLEFLFELNESVMREYYACWAPWDAVRSRFFMKRNVILGSDQIILVEGERAGLFAVDYRPARFHLRFLQIAARFQGRGIGTMLLNELLARARQENVAVTLDVLRNNPARELYERVGFKVTGERESKLRMCVKPSDNGNVDWVTG